MSEEHLREDVLSYFGRSSEGSKVSTVGAGRVVLRRGDESVTLVENDLLNVISKAGLSQKASTGMLLTPEVEALRRAARELRLSVMDGALARLLRDGRVGTFSLLGPDGKRWVPSQTASAATSPDLTMQVMDYFGRGGDQ